MMYNNKTIVLHELIGLVANVVNSSDFDQIGIHGDVMNLQRSFFELELFLELFCDMSMKKMLSDMHWRRIPESSLFPWLAAFDHYTTLDAIPASFM